MESTCEEKCHMCRVPITDENVSTHLTSAAHQFAMTSYLDAVVHCCKRLDAQHTMLVQNYHELQQSYFQLFESHQRLLAEVDSLRNDTLTSSPPLSPSPPFALSATTTGTTTSTATIPTPTSSVIDSNQTRTLNTSVPGHITMETTKIPLPHSLLSPTSSTLPRSSPPPSFSSLPLSLSYPTHPSAPSPSTPLLMTLSSPLPTTLHPTVTEPPTMIFPRTVVSTLAATSPRSFFHLSLDKRFPAR